LLYEGSFFIFDRSSRLRHGAFHSLVGRGEAGSRAAAGFSGGHARESCAVFTGDGPSYRTLSKRAATSETFIAIAKSHVFLGTSKFQITRRAIAGVRR
jgi:hypothetical protein